MIFLYFVYFRNGEKQNEANVLIGEYYEAFFSVDIQSLKSFVQNIKQKVAPHFHNLPSKQDFTDIMRKAGIQSRCWELHSGNNMMLLV